MNSKEKSQKFNGHFQKFVMVSQSTYARKLIFIFYRKTYIEHFVR